MTIINVMLLALIWLVTMQWTATVDAFIANHTAFATLRHETLAAPERAIHHVCAPRPKANKGLLNCETELSWWQDNIETSVCEDLGGAPPRPNEISTRRRYRLSNRCTLQWPGKGDEHSNEQPLITLALPPLEAKLIR